MGKNYSKPTRPTRSVLEVNLVSPSGESISVFGVHFPSPRHFIEERQDAFDTLERAVYGKKSDLIVAAGDFNITANEDSRMQVLHVRQMGCESPRQSMP